jgi:predicted MFS family arabinose efflux permease
MLMTGALGMLCSTLPVQWLLPVLGWRPLFWVLAGLTVLAVLLIGWVVPRWQGAPAAAPAPTPASEPASPPQGDTGLWSSYRVVWRHPYFRRMVPLGVITYGGMLAMQTLWAGPWLVRVSGYSPLEAATGLFTLNAFMLVTFWAWGYFNPRLAAAGWSADRVITWGAPLNLLALLFLIYRGPEAGPLTWTLFCMTNSCMSLAQPAVGMAFPPAQAGRALSGYNLVMFSGVFAAQWGIGLLIDGFMRLDWTVVASFQGALAVYGVLSAIAYVHFLRRAGDNANVAP